MLPETLNEIALGVSRPATDLADDIYMLCEWIQAQGNRGYSLEKLVGEGLPVYFLEQPLLIADILFHAVASRKSDYSGWGVKRNPMIAGEVWQWEQKWLSRFGHLNIPRVVEVQTKIEQVKNPGITVGDWAEWGDEVYSVVRIDTDGTFWLESIYSRDVHTTRRADIQPAKAPRRKRSGQFEMHSTFDIAYRAACADVLEEWHLRKLTAGNNNHRDAITLWNQRGADLRDELVYRVHAAPPILESQKKTKAAADDWAKAREYLQKGTRYFFSQGFVNTVIGSAEYPDLTINPDHLPKLPPDKTPVKWKSDRELMNDVMRWLNADIDPTTFEWDDRKTFIDMARRWLATAKGEKVKEI